MTLPLSYSRSINLKSERLLFPPSVNGAHDQDRTGDLVLTKDVLCQLSYVGRFGSNRPHGQGRIRTSVARKERQIYSLLPLTTRPPVRNGGNCRYHFAYQELAKGFEPPTC